jgi:hypothetical protein
VTGHQLLTLKMFSAISEAVLTTYGFVPRPVLEDITAQVIATVVLEQAYLEREWREIAYGAGLSAPTTAAMVAELHAPIGGAV